MMPLRAAITVALAFLLTSGPARAAQPVDVTLVLVDDVSLSIDDQEFDLQKQGYYAAFSDPRVIAAIKGGPHGRIAVDYVEFASDFQVETIVGWNVISDAASARAFAEQMRAAPRSARGRTAIGEGIAAAVHELAGAGFDAPRRVIDVCGDGANNSGRDVDMMRDDAVRQGITINGLAIANDSPLPYIWRHTHPPGGLAHYYEEHVTGGEGSFVIEIHNFQSFAEAITRKLLNEIASADPMAGRVPAFGIP